MKRLLFGLALIALGAPAWAAGTATVTTSAVGAGVIKYSVAWVCDASGVVSSATWSIKAGHIWQVNQIPDGGGTQPSDLYDMTIGDANSADILAGTGANLSNAGPTYRAPLIGDGTNFNQQLYVESGTVTLTIANAGNAKGGTVVLFIGP